MNKNRMLFDELCARFPEASNDQVRLAILILNDVLMESTQHAVLCGDVFEYACADCEEVAEEDIADLFEMFCADPQWGSMAWCIAKRKKTPIEPRVEAMKAAGAWDEEMLLPSERCYKT